jgi:predicted NUDIX family NTP pyrophosphohydrolase
MHEAGGVLRPLGPPVLEVRTLGVRKYYVKMRIPLAVHDGTVQPRRPSLGDTRVGEGPPLVTCAAMKPGTSAGILLFRRNGSLIEILLAHPGGPYWRNQQYESWSLPKGIAEDGEELEAVAAREFGEETGFALADVATDAARPHLDLGEVTLKSGKVVRAWAVEGDLDPALSHSNEFEIEWPPRSGRRQMIPEVDRVAWFEFDEARRRAHPAQAEFVDRLEERLADQPGDPADT